MPFGNGLPREGPLSKDDNKEGHTELRGTTKEIEHGGDFVRGYNLREVFRVGLFGKLTKDLTLPMFLVLLSFILI